MNNPVPAPYAPQHTGLVKTILSPESRAKITLRVDAWDDDGLYGQFPEITKQSELWKGEMLALFKKAEDVLAGLLEDSEFANFFKETVRLSMGWTVNEVLINSANPPCGWHIWSVNLGDNKNLALVFTDQKRLVLGTHQYVYQDDHTQPFHWFLRHDAKPAIHAALRMDNRLHCVLNVLSDPERAKTFLRAKIHFMETFHE